MDDIVRQAMAKWPHVPHCYGWLGMDARGDYYMRDDRVQAQGAFGSSPAAKGSRVNHEKLLAFIHRNLAADARGCWYFQNGPQRVYIELEAAPHVWRLQPDGRVLSASGLAAQWREPWLDEQGRLFFDSDIGFGLVHTQDMAQAADWLQAHGVQPATLRFAEMPARFGYVLSPQAAQREAPAHRTAAQK
jgi:hypothetical protein